MDSLNRTLVVYAEPVGPAWTHLQRLAEVLEAGGKSVCTLRVEPSAAPTSDASDAGPWLKRFASLPPLLLRNYLCEAGRRRAELTLARWPEGDAMAAMPPLLGAAFDWLLVLVTAETFMPPWLDSAHAVFWLAKGDHMAATGRRALEERLAPLLFPTAYLHTVLYDMSGEAPMPALSVLPPCTGPGLRYRQALQTLAASLAENGSLCRTLAPRFTEKSAEDQAVQQLKEQVQPELLRHLETRQKQGEGGAKSDVHLAKQTVETLLAAEPELGGSRAEREHLATRVLEEVLGLGPLEPLLKDATVTEVMVNGHGCVFVEREGRLELSDTRFSSDAQLRTVIDRIVAPIGRRVDESMPLCDARLSDGSRVNIVLPPLAIDGPTLTVRKFSSRPFTLADLAQRGALSEPMRAYLENAVIRRRNIVVAGGTGSGKTTLLNALSRAIPHEERIVTIEDAAELRLQKPHVVRLEARPANAEGQGEIPIRRLVANALRMRPDRIVIGECRGGEALDMLQAMNTGHDGSLTTLHANSPRDALGRLETLVLMAGLDLPVRVVREQIRSAVHLLVQQSRLPDGSRRVTSITELTGMEGDTLVTQELFRWTGTCHESTGMVSR